MHANKNSYGGREPIRPNSNFHPQPPDPNLKVALIGNLAPHGPYSYTQDLDKATT